MISEKIQERLDLWPVFFTGLIEAKILQAQEAKISSILKSSPHYWTDEPRVVRINPNCTFDEWLFHKQRYDLVDWVMFEPYPPFQYYDPLKQVQLKPGLRKSTIMQYDSQGIEGLFAEIQGMIRNNHRITL